jgi:hypothetical protein
VKFYSDLVAHSLALAVALAILALVYQLKQTVRAEPMDRLGQYPSVTATAPKYQELKNDRKDHRRGRPNLRKNRREEKTASKTAR